MRRIRVIPVLLLQNTGLYKTVRFRDPKYVGDPINAVKIFNEKEVDELMLLDIKATTESTRPNFKLINEIASECFMPVSYGGGINSLDDAKAIFDCGIEKISLNSAAFEKPAVISEIASKYGSQAVVVNIDVKKNLFGKYHCYIRGGNVSTKIDPVTFAKQMEDQGAGELVLNSVDRDGMMAGYDVELLAKVCNAVSIPVIASGGAGSIDHFVEAVKAGRASAVAAGSFFVFHGKHKAVLINFPTQKDLIPLYNVNN